MKSAILTSISAVSLLAALAMPVRLAAQEHREKAEDLPHYTVTDLGTLGGTYSYAYSINNAGWVSGGAATPTQTDGVAQTAFLWSKESGMRDLGTLGGPSSEADVSNAGTESAIFSETTMLDPLGEDFCRFGTRLQCLAAIWKNGVMTALPTLVGGHNAQAYWVNKRGQVVGFSENGTSDPDCKLSTPFQVLRVEAVIWKRNGEIHELPPLPGDTVGYAFGINDKGEAVGSSGVCASTSLPPVAPSGLHAVLWEKDGSATDLGNLGGGGTNNTASSVNNRGEVVGGSQSSIDGNIHPFLWTRETGMQDLGAFPGAFLTAAPCCNTINDRGEVVGFSLSLGASPTGPPVSRALLWEDKVMMDLNTLIPADSGWYLQAAQSINDDGEIVGFGLINGNVHAFLARPCDRDHADGDGCEDNR